MTIVGTLIGVFSILVFILSPNEKDETRSNIFLFGGISVLILIILLVYVQKYFSIFSNILKIAYLFYGIGTVEFSILPELEKHKVAPDQSLHNLIIFGIIYNRKDSIEILEETQFKGNLASSGAGICIHQISSIIFVNQLSGILTQMLFVLLFIFQ